MKDIAGTIEIKIPLNTMNPPVRNVGRIQDKFIEADKHLASVSEEVNNLERLWREEERRRREQERIRLERQFSQD